MYEIPYRPQPKALGRAYLSPEFGGKVSYELRCRQCVIPAADRCLLVQPAKFGEIFHDRCLISLGYFPAQN